MNPRPDCSDKLVHFTSGKSLEEAFDRLQEILGERQLIGHGDKIRGGYPCVCFSEAPLVSLQHGLVNPSAYSRYAPFGIIFEKAWAFDQGGRPVIYQPDADFALLSEEIRWRHMRYEPPAIDLTWEREWRIQTNSLLFAPNVAGVVVPEKKWADALLAEHDATQDFEVFQYAQIIDGNLAEQYREPFPWRVYVLR